MHSHLPFVLALLALLGFVAALTQRWRVPLPVLLAGAGVVFGCVPGTPRASLHPELILTLFLPPLLYTDAFHTSWTDFQRSLRPILMLAVGLVVFTTLSVGLVAHACLPQLPWAACFLLGAIVSPTDTIAVQAVIERLRVPRRITAVLGGESLVNDATGLVCVQVVTAVLLSGTFEASEVAGHFARVAGLGIAVGLLVGAAFALGNRIVRDTQVLFVLSLISPYLAFLLAEEVEASGVLAVVVAGFVVAWRIHHLHAEARIQLNSTWEQIVFVLNGLCFLFIGLQVPRVIEDTGAVSSGNLVLAGLAVSAAVVLSRIAWCLPGSVIPLPFARGRREFSTWKHAALVSWAGVRGVVSLAAALALPELTADGAPFPGRNAILACTLFVVVTTLLVQGLTLLPLIHALGIRDDEDSTREVRHAREAVLGAGISKLDSYCSENACPLSIHHLRMHMVDELHTLQDEDLEEKQLAISRLNVSMDVRREIMTAQESVLLHLRDHGKINDRTYHRLLLELDRANLAIAPRKAA
ncbi:MAG: Na+/H+ antiporter [Planctomycetes bacterium]|nr:Na+/H+ antiporter [Planctomycetota bacterium]